MNAMGDAYIDRNRNDTDALAQALAEGIVIQDEDGSLRSTDDAALAELGISTKQLKYFEM
jgi:sensor histidine kinase regulating citrate/malate metabolism